ncbi:ATP-binding protein [Streptomyces caniferus]|uniref:ATP-binding protein n=1 Tax=Streptomyces caniferus TaxID=285557 RepID=UPI003453C9C8
MLPVITPALRRGLLDARRQLRKNRFRSVGRSTNMIIDGDRGTGKTTLLVQIGRGFHGLIEADLGHDPNRIPVVYINVPPERESNLHWSLPFAEFLGLNHTLNPGDRTRRPADMTEPVARVMERAKTQLVLIDGVDRIQDNEVAAAFDYFEALQDRTRITYIFCGTGPARSSTTPGMASGARTCPTKSRARRTSATCRCCGAGSSPTARTGTVVCRPSKKTCACMTTSPAPC